MTFADSTELFHIVEVAYRPIANFPGYCVSDIGSVWSRLALGWRRGLVGKWRLLSGTKDRKGYLNIVLYCDAQPSTLKIHRLVLGAFVGPCPTGMECRHLDGSVANNQRENLAWGTHKENASDKKRHGTECCGENSALSKLSDSKVAEMRRRAKSGESMTALAIIFGVNRRTVLRAVRGRTWKHVLEEPVLMT